MPGHYAAQTYGDTPVGTGARPGIVVVDFQLGFTDPQYPLGGAPLIERAVVNTAKLLDAARRMGVPVANCNTCYMDQREMPYWKVSGVRETFLHDHPSVAYDPRIFDKSYDLAVTKKGPSILFETGVVSYFIKQRVDTVIVTGCTTSGCIRATTIDSFANRFRTLVPEDCVGDHEEQPHKDNLRDVGVRYADIVDLDFCLAYFEDLRKRNAD
ncbi:MAG: isochorismatase family protein [Rhodospirillaceae bacterium]|nr:isochorismatase family protein [Rhodospirillaceae bacterium]MCA8931499.1 isochorismatase family protein [Rhodospirillaceae bacterium]